MAFEHYTGRCIGRLMHFLYDYDIRSDEAIFHSPSVIPMITIHGGAYANYTWDSEVPTEFAFDVPTFIFHGEFALLNSVQAMRKREWLLRHNQNVADYMMKYCPSIPRPQQSLKGGWTPEMCKALDIELTS